MSYNNQPYYPQHQQQFNQAAGPPPGQGAAMQMNNMQYQPAPIDSRASYQDVQAYQVA
jgi:hypothetical protein